MQKPEMLSKLRPWLGPVVVFASVLGAAQTKPQQTAVKPPHRTPRKSTPNRGFLSDLKAAGLGIASDQKYIWTSPARLKISDAAWLAPTAGVAAGLFATDTTTSRELTRSSYKQRSATFSDVGVGALGATSAAMYLLGAHEGNNKMRETGLLSGEAGVDALAVDEVLKYGFSRDRPDVNNAQGRFFQSGGRSFPSGHAATSFAIATVIANEYPGPLTKLLSYGLATGVSFARVTGQQHFLSDVFIGGAMGYFVGRSVYRNHHDPG